MNEIHGLFRHHEPPIANQKSRSIGAVTQGSKPEKHTSLILGGKLEIPSIQLAKIPDTKTSKRWYLIEIKNPSGFCLIDRDTVISGAALCHGIDQSTMFTNNISCVLGHVCVEHHDSNHPADFIYGTFSWTHLWMLVFRHRFNIHTLSRKANTHGLWKNLTCLISEKICSLGTKPKGITFVLLCEYRDASIFQILQTERTRLHRSRLGPYLVVWISGKDTEVIHVGNWTSDSETDWSDWSWEINNRHRRAWPRLLIFLRRIQRRNFSLSLHILCDLNRYVLFRTPISFQKIMHPCILRVWRRLFF